MYAICSFGDRIIKSIEESLIDMNSAVTESLDKKYAQSYADVAKAIEHNALKV